MDIDGLYREVKAAMAVLYGAGQRDTAGADAFLRAVQEKPECVWMGLTYIPQAQSSDESLLLATMVKHALGRVLAALDDSDKQAVFQKVRRCIRKASVCLCGIGDLDVNECVVGGLLLLW
jgi:hypothetical protein